MPDSRRRCNLRIALPFRCHFRQAQQEFSERSANEAMAICLLGVTSAQSRDDEQATNALYDKATAIGEAWLRVGRGDVRPSTQASRRAGQERCDACMPRGCCCCGWAGPRSCRPGVARSLQIGPDPPQTPRQNAEGERRGGGDAGRGTEATTHGVLWLAATGRGVRIGRYLAVCLSAYLSVSSFLVAAPRASWLPMCPLSPPPASSYSAGMAARAAPAYAKAAEFLPLKSGSNDQELTKLHVLAASATWTTSAGKLCADLYADAIEHYDKALAIRLARGDETGCWRGADGA